MDEMPKYLSGAARFLFVAIWLLLLAYFVHDVALAPILSDVGLLQAIDVSRRVTAPDGGKAALLTREYHFDANLRLWIVDEPYTDVPEEIEEALWSSRDYMPSTQKNWHEDIEWSADSTAVAVTVDGEYVFAYDFDTSQRLEDKEDIRKLLESRSQIGQD